MSNALKLHPKVTAGLLAGWITTIVLYSLDYWFQIDPPAEVGAAILGIVTFVCGWLTPSS